MSLVSAAKNKDKEAITIITEIDRNVAVRLSTRADILNRLGFIWTDNVLVPDVSPGCHIVGGDLVVPGVS